MREPIVSIVKCKDLKWETSVPPAVRQAVDLIGGMESLISLGDTVILKPNLISEKRFETGAVTNPSVIQAAVTLAKEAGARKIIIADGSAVGKETREAFVSNGLDTIAENEKNVECVDFKKCEFVPVSIANGKIFKRLRVPAIFLEANVIINVPVMKTHDALPVTLGLKNMKGIIHEQDKKRFHKWGLEQSIVDLNQIALPELTILDGTIGMEGLGPNSGDPVNLGLVMASTDTVALDAVACGVMGIPVEEVRYIGMAAEAGLGCADITRIDVVGLTVEEVVRPFKRITLSTGDYDQYGLEIVQKGACSGCNHFVETLITQMIDDGRVERLRGATLIFGQNAAPSIKSSSEKDDSKTILIGTCMRKYKQQGTYIPGCPPHPVDFFDLLK